LWSPRKVAKEQKTFKRKSDVGKAILMSLLLGMRLAGRKTCGQVRGEKFLPSVRKSESR